MFNFGTAKCHNSLKFFALETHRQNIDSYVFYIYTTFHNVYNYYNDDIIDMYVCVIIPLSLNIRTYNTGKHNLRIIFITTTLQYKYTCIHPNSTYTHTYVHAV